MDARVNAAQTDQLARMSQQIADLQRQVTELRAARRLTAASIDASDGSLRVVDGGVELLRVGDLGGGFRGVAIRRRTGDQAISAWSTAPGDPGFVAPLWDLSGNYVITDDVESRRGLARPYLPIPMADSLSFPTATVTSSTFASVSSGKTGLENPGLLVALLVRSDTAGTTGEAQMSIDGNLVGPALSFTFGFGFSQIGPFGHGIADYGNVHSVDLMLRRTAGTGTVGARVLAAIGVESSFF